MDKKAWQGQTLQAAEGIKTAVSVLGKKKKKEKRCICSAVYLLIQRDAGTHYTKQHK